MTKLEQQLIKHEGLRLQPYLDTVGKWTIGVGRNLSDNGISESEALLMLRNDIATAERELMSQSWFNALDAVRKDVMINMCFNIGLTRLLGFKNMIAALTVHDYDKAATEMLDSKWARQVGNRAIELSNIMRSGKC